jgi:YidC/Oxa1 family membrane protein insertase
MQKNFLLFIVLCILILVGWSWLQNQIWPPPPPKKPGDTVAKKEEPKKPDEKKKDEKKDLDKPAPPLPPLKLGLARPQELFASLLTVPAWNVPGFVHPQVLVGDLVLTERSTAARAASQLAAALQPDPRGPLVPHALGSHLLLAREALTPGKKPLPTREAPGLIVLGDDKFHLNVELTTEGGAVQSITLPKFQEASDLGKPVFKRDVHGNFVRDKNNRKVEAPLVLVPPDKYNHSYALYHYPNPSADPDKPEGRPALELGREIWKVELDPKTKKAVRELPDGRREVVLSFDRLPGFPDLKIVRTYTLGPRDYHIGVQVEIIDSRNPARDTSERRFKYQMAGGHGLPIEGEWYASVHLMPFFGLINQRGNFWRDLDETQHRVWVGQGGDKVPPVPDSFIQYAGVGNQYFVSLIVVDNEQVSGTLPRDVVSYARATLESQEKAGILKDFADDYSWVEVSISEKGMGDVRYHLLERARKQARDLKLAKADAVCVNGYEAHGVGMVGTGIRRGRVPRYWQTDLMVRTVSEVKLRPGGKAVHKYLLYNGPVKVALLSQFTGDKAVDSTLVDRYWDTLNLRTLTDYRSPGPLGWFANQIFWTDLIILFTRLMNWLLDWLHWVVPNYGIAIILLTIIVRSLMIPISRKQAYLSIKMQEIAPQIKELQKKYKDSQQRTRAVMELYRKHQVNPFGGCLTLLLQLPIFMGLYYCLQESIHFRLAGFLWMPNLAAPDMLLWWGEGIPLISDPDNMGNIFYLGPFLNVLPVVAVALMLAQQKMLTPPPADEQQAFQQKLMKWMLIFFGILFYKVAAGLCIYFVVSSVWGLLERKFLPKKGATPAGPPAGGGGGDGGGGGGGPGKPAGPGPGGGKRKGKKDKKAAAPKGRIGTWWQDLLDKAKKK